MNMSWKKIISALFFLIIAVIVLNFKDNFAASAAEEKIISYFRQYALDLGDSSGLSRLIDAASAKQVVLLGEASHGTSEYYRWRTKISRRLIEEGNFSFILVEGDWPSCFKVNLYVKGKLEEDAGELLRRSFQRWPRWMWANKDVIELVEWLKEYNAALPMEERVGFYGMDVYSLEESVKEIKKSIDQFKDARLLELKDKYACFKPFGYDGFSYARAVFQRDKDCRPQVLEAFESIGQMSEELSRKDPYGYFNLKMNAKAVKNAERYYRSAVTRGPQGWNNRVYHMEGVLHRLLDFYGGDSKGIVWAHNTHVGDARATSMRQANQVNIGQLSREAFGRENVFIAGFGTYQGTVVAGSQWGAPWQVIRVPSGQKGSIEYILNQVDKDSFLLLFDRESRTKNYLTRPRGHRAIGVVYDPRVEHRDNYVPTVLVDRYDAFFFFRDTSALTPLGDE